MQSLDFNNSSVMLNKLNIEIFENALVIVDKDWNFTHISSPFHRMYFILEADAGISNENERVIFERSRVYLVPCNTCYDYFCNSQMKKLYIHFNFEVFPGTDIFKNLDRTVWLNYDIEKINHLIELFRENSVVGILEAKTILTEVILRFVKLVEKEYGLKLEYNAFNKYSDILQHISENLYADIKIKEVSEKFNIEYTSLSRNFKSDTGIGLKEYFEKMLLNRAKQMLVLTELNINEIAYQLHFCDQYYFSSFFKRYENVSPKEYRSKYSVVKKKVYNL